MQLLVFAHRGEASCFLKNLPFQTRPEFPQLYYNEKIALLICGEGLYSALEKTLGALWFLEQINFKTTTVVNLGLVRRLTSGLDESLYKEAIISIRNVFASESSTPLYHSYQSADVAACYDCLSFSQRVVSTQISDELSPIAPLLDRELWGVARACYGKKLKWFSYKLISDLGHEEHFCDTVFARAEELSTRLFEFYQAIPTGVPSDGPVPRKESWHEKVFESPQFHWTYSHLQLFEKQKSLILRTHSKEKLAKVIEQICIIIPEHLTPKQKTHHFLTELQAPFFPSLYTVRQKIHEELQSLKKRTGQNGSFDWSSGEVLLQVRLKDSTDCQKLGTYLSDSQTVEQLFQTTGGAGLEV